MERISVAWVNRKEDRMSKDTIYRQAVLDLFAKNCDAVRSYSQTWEEVKELPSAQPDRDIPKKPRKITDSTWGIHKKQAVCPKCDYYLGHVAFLGDGKGKKITYCEHCGQAIDWEGWIFDE